MAPVRCHGPAAGGQRRLQRRCKGGREGGDDGRQGGVQALRRRRGTEFAQGEGPGGGEGLRRLERLASRVEDERVEVQRLAQERPRIGVLRGLQASWMRGAQLLQKGGDARRQSGAAQL
jgi:hypothetical protein